MPAVSKLKEDAPVPKAWGETNSMKREKEFARPGGLHPDEARPPKR